MTMIMRRCLGGLLALALLFAPARAMDNPGPLPLGNASGADFAIGAAATQVGLPVTTLTGMARLTCSARFAYGSGGTQTLLYIQTSLDQGQSWIDIAAFQFGMSGALEVINLPDSTAVTTPTTPSSQSLTPNTTFGGVLGDRLQAVVVSTGTYVNTLLSVRCVVR